MNQKIFLFLFLLLPFAAMSQVEGPPLGRSTSDGPKPVAQVKDKPPVTDYKIISVKNDTTVVDTSLSIYKDFRFNYLREDNFGLLPFSNVGQTYNQLTYRFERPDNDLTPDFGARARHYNFMEVDDIYYFHVPTPFTEVYFKTVFEQGQTLSTLFTVNTSKNLNVFIAYKGLRSLGKYQHLLTSTGNFRAGLSYNTSNKRYRVKTHFASQDLMNQENGGLSELALEQYLSGNEEYTDRSRLQMNFNDAESTLFGKRFFLQHSFDLFSATDSTSYNRLTLGHTLNFSDKKFLYKQSGASDFLGASFETVNLRDELKHENIFNEAFLEYNNQLVGRFRVKAALTNYNYGYNSVLELEEGRIPNRLLGETIAAGGEYSRSFGPFSLYADATLGVSGEFKGNHLEAGVSYTMGEENKADFRIIRNDQAPNFNFLLYQSDYINYNWYNDFSNVKTNLFEVSLDFPKLAKLEATYTSIKDYAYFSAVTGEGVKPFQHNGTINYFSVSAMREFRYGKFALHNTLLYQNVLDGEGVFNKPDFITRNTLYFQDHWFKRALFLQTGLTLNYFTGYKMDGYDPVLAEFYVENSQEFEGFPTVDFFFNGKIRQARIFFKLEHLNSLLLGNDNFSAPLHPYRDFAVRFGLVWNFFM